MTGRRSSARARTVLLLGTVVIMICLLQLISVSTSTLAKGLKKSSSPGGTVSSQLRTFHDKDAHIRSSLSDSKQQRDVRYKFRSAQPRPGSGIPTECGAAPKYADFFAQNMTRRSARGEDHTIYHRFFDHMSREEMKDFTYLEIGGFTGMDESNSRFFDECLGWNGLLIEANPTAFPLMKSNRPHADCLNMAGSCGIGKNMSTAETVLFLTTHSKPWSNSPVAGTPGVNEFAKAHRVRPVRVPCGSLTPIILDHFPNGHVTFFSLDVEGTEHDVVANIDFDQVTIDIIISENFNMHCLEKCPSRTETRKILHAAGYLLYEDLVDKSDLYVHANSPFAARLPDPATLKRETPRWKENVDYVLKRREATAQSV